jgi:hypothetical protein
MTKPLVAITHVKAIYPHFLIVGHVEDAAKTVTVSTQHPHVTPSLG